MSDRAVRRIRNVMWSSSPLALVAGFIIGWNIDAVLGAGLLYVAAILAFAPFASHRNRHTGRWANWGPPND